jgi:hypothetical protein
MEDEIVARFCALFAGSDRGFGSHGVPVQEPGAVKWTIRNTAITKAGPATLEHWKEHLKGGTPLGVIPIRGDNKCFWGSIDIDEYHIDLGKIIAKIAAAGLPLVPCRSKSGGLHLFIFLTEWMPAEVLNPLLIHLAAQLGLSNKTEIFPKQLRLIGEHDRGNWITMPYGQTFDGKLRNQVGLRADGTEMTAVEFLDHAESVRVSPELADELRATRIRARGSARPGVQVGANAAKDGEPFSDGPPCLQHMVANGILVDGRKRALYQMAVYYKKVSPENWESRIEEANQLYMKPPLGSEDVSGLIRSMGKKEYRYKCRESPMQDHCDSRLCGLRTFGVGQDNVPIVISQLTMYNIDPPIWFVDVPGGRVEVSTEELMDFRRFNIACGKQIRLSFAVVKHAEWTSMVSIAMHNSQTIEVPKEVGMVGQFKYALSEYLTNRASGQRADDLSRDRPWFDEEGTLAPGAGPRYYFKLIPLTKHLNRNNWPLKEFGQTWITLRIADFGGAAHPRGPHGNLWWVPAEAVEVSPFPTLPKPRSSII